MCTECMQETKVTCTSRILRAFVHMCMRYFEPCPICNLSCNFFLWQLQICIPANFTMLPSNKVDTTIYFSDYIYIFLTIYHIYYIYHNYNW